MGRIAATFESLRLRRQTAFMPFLAAGDPDISTTVELVRLLAGCGVDLIEIGFPYSDPIADGPVIQEAYTRALAKKIGVADIFGALEALKGETLPPLLAMVAYAIVYRAGPEKFAAAAKRAGFSGMIVPDLPGDQASELFAIAQAHELDLVQLVAPTTTPDRVDRILKSSSGFVYCIAVAGTTGVRQALPQELKSELETLRLKTKLPLAVGFGIGRADQIESLRGLADGVIVGSAIVRHVGRLSSGDAPRAAVMEELARFARELAAAAHKEAIKT
ncbi:MAG TPA: tryptophan synthase subunit alpha [Planctomycetaceae bacterium]|jgi:tryptophan synthase alpha chain|nr:tryptophan synthase subunit alpha [Planctomycetaceae bacterium]